jgi:hypothetical protein
MHEYRLIAILEVQNTKPVDIRCTIDRVLLASPTYLFDWSCPTLFRELRQQPQRQAL